MQTPPIEVRDDKGALIGMRCKVHGITKYIPIELSVVAALRCYKEAMKIPEPPYSEPEWDELTEEEEKDLAKFDAIDNLVKQAF